LGLLLGLWAILGDDSTNYPSKPKCPETAFYGLL